MVLEGELRFQPGVARAQVSIGAQAVAEGDVVTPPAAVVGDDVGVHETATICSSYAELVTVVVRAVGVVAHGVAGGAQPLGDVVHRRAAVDADHEIDDRFRAQARYGRAADVGDRDRAVAENVGDRGTLALLSTAGAGPVIIMSTTSAAQAAHGRARSLATAGAQVELIDPDHHERRSFLPAAMERLAELDCDLREAEPLPTPHRLGAVYGDRYHRRTRFERDAPDPRFDLSELAGAGTAALGVDEEHPGLLDPIREVARQIERLGDGIAAHAIVRKALQSPARQIAINAGEDGSVIVGKILEKDQYSYGFDAQNAEYGNMLTKGIIDPTKVVRAALQNAASVAALLITTEAMVAELPKKQSAAPQMPPGGGMDF